MSFASFIGPSVLTRVFRSSDDDTFDCGIRRHEGKGRINKSNDLSLPQDLIMPITCSVAKKEKKKKEEKERGPRCTSGCIVFPSNKLRKKKGPRHGGRGCH